MPFFNTVLLGLIQGFTEFLPVSSSGHLVIAQSLMSHFDQPGILFDTLLHLATLFAVLIFFRRRVGLLFVSLLGLVFKRWRVTYFENRRFLWGIVIASIPTAAIGLFMADRVESLFASPVYVGYALILTSVLLMASDKVRGGSARIGPASSGILGFVQGLAIMPGISRSGSTISVAIFLGIERDEAAEFSFLMSVPAILGAVALQMRHINVVEPAALISFGVGMAAAFISGLFAIGVMMALVRQASLKGFALYCLILGIVSIIWI